MELTCALLHTDLIDSTSTNDRLGDAAMGALWDAHDTRSRELLREWRGREVDRSDGFSVFFEAVEDAASFARAYHCALSELPVPLKARAGLHVGVVTLRHNTAADIALGARPLEIVGVAKAMCARLMGLAQGGRTLASAAAAERLASSGWTCRSHGFWRLKGIEEPLEVFEVGDETTVFEPPPDAEKAYCVVRAEGQWVTRSSVPARLPTENNLFCGRRDALQALARAMDGGHRLISLVGTGGIGKTRLSVRYARGWLGSYPGGAYFCDLSSARSADGVLHAVAQALNVSLASDAIEQLGRVIAGRGRCLMVLDNFEQVVRHADATLGRWLDAAPSAFFLVTSRQRLGLPAEQVLPLAPLAGEDAIALFHARASAVNPVYEPTAAPEATVRSLVGMLDGLPLAIELAAARTCVLTVAKLLHGMDDRFRLLTSGHGRSARQATLQATLEWSWDGLSVPERCTLAQLSVFEGGLTMSAAEAVVDLAAVASQAWLADLVQALLDKSLVRPLESGRFGLLRSIQTFGAMKLARPASFPGAGKQMVDGVRQRHHAYFAGLDEAAAVAHRCVELDNLVRACHAAAEDGDARDAVACLSACWAAWRRIGPFAAAVELANMVQSRAQLDPTSAAIVLSVQAAAWHAMGEMARARETAERGLSLIGPAAAPSEVAVRLHCTLGEACCAQNDTNAAARHLSAALTCSDETVDASVRAQVRNALGALAWDRGNLSEAQARYEEALSIATENSDQRWQSGVLGNMGTLFFAQRRLAEAQESIEQALALAHSSGDQRWEGNMRCNLGLILNEVGRPDDAEHELGKALAIARMLGHRSLEFMTLCNLGLVCEAKGDLAAACQHHASAIAGAQSVGDWRVEVQLRACMASALARAHRHDEARACLEVGFAGLAEADEPLLRGMLLCSAAENASLDGNQREALAMLRQLNDILGAGDVAGNAELARRIEQVSALIRPC